MNPLSRLRLTQDNAGASAAIEEPGDSALQAAQFCQQATAATALTSDDIIKHLLEIIPADEPES